MILAGIAARGAEKAFDALFSSYMERLEAFVPVEASLAKSEAAFFEAIDRQRSRVAPLIVLLDSRGKQLSSEEFAGWIGRDRDQGRQLIVFAIGPADGWSEVARKRAGLLLSLGPMTLPHELARVMLCEQVYRAFTILAGHPYHSGH